MKCGKEIGETQVFCEGCLAVMDRYPVKRSVRVLLPNRTEPTPVKKPLSRKKAPSPEEKIAKMQKAIKVLSLALVAVVLALFLSVALLVDSLSSEEEKTAIGQNYSTMDNSDATQ